MYYYKDILSKWKEKSDIDSVLSFSNMKTAYNDLLIYCFDYKRGRPPFSLQTFKRHLLELEPAIYERLNPKKQKQT